MKTLLRIALANLVAIVVVTIGCLFMGGPDETCPGVHDDYPRP